MHVFYEQAVHERCTKMVKALLEFFECVYPCRPYISMPRQNSHSPGDEAKCVQSTKIKKMYVVFIQRTGMKENKKVF